MPVGVGGAFVCKHSSPPLMLNDHGSVQEPHVRVRKPGKHRIERRAVGLIPIDYSREHRTSGARAHSAVEQLYAQVGIERQVQQEVSHAAESEELRLAKLQKERREVRKQQRLEAYLIATAIPEDAEPAANALPPGDWAIDRESDVGDMPVARSPTKTTRYTHVDGRPSDVWGRTYRVRTVKDPIAMRIGQLQPPSDAEAANRLTEGFNILTFGQHPQLERPQTMSQYLEQASRLSVPLPSDAPKSSDATCRKTHSMPHGVQHTWHST
jgi:hypothetical protein